ncbi:hypothetical protein Pgy4_40435, partial [Pseudomonas savastanoi pv. glycinea str. race 4]
PAANAAYSAHRSEGESGISDHTSIIVTTLLVVMQFVTL